MAKQGTKKNYAFSLAIDSREYYLDEGVIKQNEKKKAIRKKFQFGARALVARLLVNNADINQDSHMAKTYFALQLAFAGVEDERKNWLKVANIEAGIYCQIVRMAISYENLQGRDIPPAVPGRIIMVERTMSIFNTAHNSSELYETIKTFHDVVKNAGEWPATRGVPTETGSKKPDWAKRDLSLS